MAILFSVVSSCQRHGHDPFVYLRDVLERLPGQSRGSAGGASSRPLVAAPALRSALIPGVIRRPIGRAPEKKKKKRGGGGGGGGGGG